MLAPAVTYVLALVGVPFLLAIFYSFTDVSISSARASFVGLATFRRAIEDPTFHRALGNTFLFAAVSQGLVVLLASVLATALQKDFRGKWLVRLVVLLPWVAPVSLGSIAWLWMFDSIYSVINWTLHAIGFAATPVWLGQPRWAMAAIVIVHVWRTLPLATVILLGGLSSIPQDIHDAAEIDGAGFWRHLFQITIPLVLPIQLVALLFGFVFAFTDMIVIYVLTRGGPYDSTHVLATLAYRYTFKVGKIDWGVGVFATALPVTLLFIFVLIKKIR